MHIHEKKKITRYEKYHSTRYTEYKQKDIGTSCTSVLTSRLQCFNLSKKC